MKKNSVKGPSSSLWKKISVKGPSSSLWKKYVGFHDKTRLKSENKKMEIAIPLDRVDVYLSFSERIIHLPHVYPKLC